MNDEFLAAAGQALRATGGGAALDALGWWGLLPLLDAPDERDAAFALFRAEGRELASTPALGALLAHPYAHLTGAPPGSMLAAVVRQSPRRGAVVTVVGELDGRSLLVDRPGHGVAVVEPDSIDLRSIEVPGRLRLSEVDARAIASSPSISDEDARPARARSAQLGRVALAAGILGAAERAVTLAVEHATSREQFGQAIGTFQAVRHLLAWARTDCVAIEVALAHCLRVDDGASPRFDEVLKALAGRNGRRACERSLQVLGGVGFTAEHDHHHCHSRVLALDALLGTSAELTHDLGRWLRETGADPGYTAAALQTAF